MARIGYIVTELPEQRIEEDEQRIQKENCDFIYRERYNVEGKTKELKKLIDNLNDRDEVIFLSMANAFKGVRQLCLFLNISRTPIPQGLLHQNSCVGYSYSAEYLPKLLIRCSSLLLIECSLFP